MSLVDELKKLEDLHRFGTLTDDEYSRAKALLLSTPPTSTAAPSGAISNEVLLKQLNEVKYQNELARIDREWESEKEQYYVTVNNRNHGVRQIPKPGMGWVTAFVGGGFGTLWLIMAISITSGAPNHGPFAMAKIVFPLFGLLFVAIAIGMGVYYEKKAAAYAEALAKYQARRAAVKPDDFR